jgi:hypothetical protein
LIVDAASALPQGKIVVGPGDGKGYAAPANPGNGFYANPTKF